MNQTGWLTDFLQELATNKKPRPIVSTEVRSVDFDAFFAKHRNEIGKALAFTLGDRSLAEEAVDEAMARAFQRWKAVSQYDNAAGWVYRAGLNWGRSRQRSIFRRKRREELVSRSVLEPTTDLTGVRAELVEALEVLNLDHRAVIVLRYFCDWSVEETAAALDITSGTVKSRSSRALEKLRAELDSEPRGGAHEL